MRFDRLRTRGVALILTAVVVTVAGAGGGLAVVDFGGSPADTQPQSFQSDEVTEDASGDDATETPSETPTPEPTPTPESEATADADESDAGETAAASEETEAATETAAATDTPAATETPTATPEPIDDSESGDATSTTDATDGAATETENASEQATGTENATEAENATNATENATGATADGELASCTEIDESGEYELTADVDGGSGTCFAVTASGVVLDGNGHAVSGSGSGTGIRVAGGASDVTVRNVDVSDWGVAVELGGSGASGPTANLVEVRATDSDTGVRLVEADDSAMQAVTARNNGDGLVLVDTAGVQASDVTVAGNDGTGLWLARGVSDSSFSVVQATDNGDRGIHVATGAADNFVGDATVTDNGGPGVEFADSSNNVLADSRVERNGGPGVLSYPAGGDRLENVRLADNGDGAYRDQAERAGAVADTVTLSDGASVRFDQGVTRLASSGTPESLPEGTESAGTAVEVELRDGGDATPTVTVPVEASGDVTAYQRVDGTWEELAGVTVTNGEAEIPVTGSGTVVPVVENAGDETAESTPDDGTESAPGEDTVRADTSSNEELAATDGGAATGGSAASSGPETGNAEADSSEPAASADAVDGDASAASGDAEASATTAATNDGIPASRYAFDADRFADLSARGAAQFENRSRTLVIGPAAVDEAIEYSFDVEGNVSKITAGNVTAEANDSVSRTDGTVTVDGTTSAGDAYAVDGELTAIRQTGGSTGFFVRYDGPIGTNETQP